MPAITLAEVRQGQLTDLEKGDQLWKVKNFLKKNLNKNFWHNKTRVSKLLIF